MVCVCGLLCVRNAPMSSLSRAIRRLLSMPQRRPLCNSVMSCALMDLLILAPLCSESPTYPSHSTVQDPSTSSLCSSRSFTTSSYSVPMHVSASFLCSSLRFTASSYPVPMLFSTLQHLLPMHVAFFHDFRSPSPYALSFSFPLRILAVSARFSRGQLSSHSVLGLKSLQRALRLQLSRN